MKLGTIFLTALLALSVTSGAACTGTITDGGYPSDNGGGGGEDDRPPTPEEEEQVALCIGDGEAGGT
ncbi:MAG: hypothetical protein GY811_07880, partial [Myxococcales bacterium]|nr:hypothetical protein [Myxococcales bacterium]